MLGSVQKDGRRYVRETHTDNVGLAHVVEYLAAVGVDYVAVRTARALVIAEQIAAQEAEDQDQRAVLTLVYQTAAEFAARFWAKVRNTYQGGDKITFARLIWWLIERINDGSITDAGARTTFNTAYNRSLTAGQWTTFKTDTLTPIHDRWAALQSQADL